MLCLASSRLLITGLSLVAAASALHRPAPGVNAYCELIATEIPDRVSYADSPAYNESVDSYYSGQERDFRPGCVFSPQSTEEVSRFIKLATTKIDDCSITPQFAVRSGGHMIWAGAANLDDGITVDMRAINSVALSDDKSVASLGAGGIWSDIYPQLVPHNLTVMGGRVPGIGVGGLATGGGIHFLSRRHGWACDNIYAYEIVLANGDIIEATASSHEDLWLALKGGSNNFGIVTRVDVPTWPMSLMWGGSVVFPYTPEVLDSHARAWSNFMRGDTFDDAANPGVALIYDQNAFVVGDTLPYAEVVENPPVYDSFMAIEPMILNGMSLNTTDYHVNVARGDLPPNSTRAIDIVYSHVNAEPEVYLRLYKAWEDGVNKLTDIAGLQLVHLTQPHPVTNGTNSLGLEPGRRDQVLTVLTAAYTFVEDDARMQAGMEEMVGSLEAILIEEGLYMPFKYLNYADKSQDPIGSYGEEVVARLQAVSRLYDPEGVFQDKVPGGFKLFT